MTTGGFLTWAMFINFVSSGKVCIRKLYKYDILPRACVVGGVWVDYDNALIQCPHTRLYVRVDGEDSVTMVVDVCGRCFVKSSTVQELSLLAQQNCITRETFEKRRNSNKVDIDKYENESRVHNNTNDIFRKHQDDHNSNNTNVYRDIGDSSSDNKSVASPGRSETDDNDVNNTHNTDDSDVHPNESVHGTEDESSSTMSSKLSMMSTKYMLIFLGLFPTVYMHIS